MPEQDNTPHHGFRKYGAAANESLSQREKEGQLLMKAAGSMQELIANWDSINPEDIETAIEYNRNLWGLFYNSASEVSQSVRSKNLCNNIISLGDFVFHRSAQILREQDNERQRSLFGALININKQIASGLLRA